MLNFLHCMSHSAVCQCTEGVGPFAGVLGQRATWTFTDETKDLVNVWFI